MQLSPLCHSALKRGCLAAPDPHSISSPQRGHQASAFHLPVPQLGHSLKAVTWSVIALLSIVLVVS